MSERANLHQYHHSKVMSATFFLSSEMTFTYLHFISSTRGVVRTITFGRGVVCGHYNYIYIYVVIMFKVIGETFVPCGMTIVLDAYTI